MLQEQDSTRLDELIGDLREAKEKHCDMLLEHLESARSYFIGAMPAEYLLSLGLASKALDCVSNEHFRHRAAELIESLLTNLKHRLGAARIENQTEHFAAVSP